ncbi:MAG: hypothetical protein GY751_21310 [Bacteroidetes bacterium]|nr:hypothetical protein [Bacteroidota bacterium]
MIIIVLIMLVAKPLSSQNEMVEVSGRIIDDLAELAVMDAHIILSGTGGDLYGVSDDKGEVFD